MITYLILLIYARKLVIQIISTVITIKLGMLVKHMEDIVHFLRGGKLMEEMLLLVI